MFNTIKDGGTKFFNRKPFETMKDSTVKVLKRRIINCKSKLNKLDQIN